MISEENSSSSRRLLPHRVRNSTTILPVLKSSWLRTSGRNELEELEQEQKQLANAEEIKESLCAAENLLEAVPAGGEEVSVTGLIRDASRHLEKISSYMPEVSSIAERLESCRLELDDIISELADVNASTEVSGDRLPEVEERLSMLYSLLRAYSCRTVGGTHRSA